MRHSFELYFLVNFAIDAALLAVVARANECMKLRRVLLSSLLSATYALLTETVSARLAHPAIQLILLSILGLVLCGDPEPYRWIPLCLQLTGGAMLLGGVTALFPDPNQLPFAAIGAGLVLSTVIFGIRSRRILSWEVTVLISLQGRCVSFRALIDSGNRLREPISGLPVLIAESELLHEFPINTLPCRQVAFGALSGSGSIKCFRPDAVLIRRGDSFLRAPDVWVAAYSGRIPGSTRALAPPSFAVIPGKI